METGSTGERNEGGQSDEPNKAAARQRVRNLTQSHCFRIYRLFACVSIGLQCGS
jgi:hypothetical protein